VPVTRISRIGSLQEQSGAAGPIGRGAPESLSAAGRRPGMRVGVFFSSDGDSAELTGRAMNLFRGPPAGAGGLSPQPGAESAANNVSGYQPDLPSSLVDWKDYAQVPNSSLDILNQPPPDGVSLETAAPASAWPASPPQEVVLPHVPLPAPKPAASGTPETAPASASAGAPADKNTAASLEGLTPPGECKTCASRKYVDDSNDPSVSFQTPTGVSANMSTAAVASHENEHVSNERAKAYRDDREIINQTVTLKYAVCPECGKTYASGGNTRTVSRDKPESDQAESEAFGPGLPGDGSEE